MNEFSLARNILLLKMLKYVSVAQASRMISVYDMFVVVSEKHTKKKLRFGALPLLNVPKKKVMKQQKHCQDLTDGW